jgi:hypothetical protein
MTEVTATTSTETTDGTTEQSDSTESMDTGASDTTEGTTASAAPAGEQEAKLDLESVPAELRTHVEKYAKKYEQDFKGTYTKKFQELSNERKLWETERAQHNAEREQWKTVAQEVLQDPKKLDAYRKIYNIPDPATQPDPDAIPETVKTVGDLLAWNKQQIQTEKEKLRAELFNESKNIVASTLNVQKWDTAIKTSQSDKFFKKYEDVILEKAKKDEDLQLKYRSGLLTETQVLEASREKLRTMMREDMEEVKAATLAEQRKKVGASTTVPTKTLPTAANKPASREDVIARVRSRLGPAQVSD